MLLAVFARLVRGKVLKVLGVDARYADLYFDERPRGSCRANREV
jgi:hypothetical protein